MVVLSSYEKGMDNPNPTLRDGNNAIVSKFVFAVLKGCL